MTKIIAFGNFKQSGKSSSCEFIKYYITSQTKVTKTDSIITDFAGNPWKYTEPLSVKIYSFADKLKEFCVDCLGLSREACYGTDEEKNAPTHIKWEDMPGVVDEIWWDKLQTGNWYDQEIPGITFHKRGAMSGREVLQYFGTGICRKMCPNVWVDACLRQIKKDNLDFALLADTRFKNEADAIRAVGGKIIGFTRRPFPEDNHPSETDLIGYPFDAIVDNQNMSLGEKNERVLQIIRGWGWL